MTQTSIGKRTLSLVLLIALTGCSAAPGPYRYIPPYDHGVGSTLREGEPQIERGRPVVIVDVLGNIISVPWKIVFLNGEWDSHEISEESEKQLREYLEGNNLEDVKIRLNQYAPVGDWKRLIANKKVHWFWRLTFGSLSVLIENLSIGRLTGSWIVGDHYNPWTDTVHIYSDIPAVLLHEGGHAKDYAVKRFPGLYGLSGFIPGVNLWQEYAASRDVIRWYPEKYPNVPRDELDAYYILYPAYGSHVGSTVGDFAPGPGFLWTGGGVMIGHLSGWLHGGVRKRQLQEQGKLPTDEPKRTTIKELRPENR